MGLCITRKVNEVFTIGDAIRVAVIRIEGGAVRLLIDAPPSLKITRVDEPIPAEKAAPVAFRIPDAGPDKTRPGRPAATPARVDRMRPW